MVRKNMSRAWIARAVAILCVAGVGASTLAANAQQAGSSDPTGPLTAALAAQLSQNVSRPVIVVMKNRLAGADAAADQAPVVNELRKLSATRIKPYRMVNAFAATVSDGMAARLKANPAVATVVPDVVIHRQRTRSAAAAASGAAPMSNASPSLTLNTIPGACGAGGQVQLDPEALQTTNTASLNPTAKTARSLGMTGAGVKVAYIADGVDPNNVNFIRSNLTSAFVDYQDFSGDGPGQPTDGGEAFLDANAIAGQGIQVYNVNGFGAQPDPSACNIRIEGVAPGAALVGLDVFGTFEDTTESNFLQAIEYAVTVDHVDVLNESFGSNPIPDVTAQDVTKLFNDAAVAAGVTVVVASGDAGSTNTIGSPATDPNVIAVGASTTFRFYAQTNYAAARYFATTGWLNDNISSFSSSGFSETGQTIDLVAPGDLAFASCDASPTYAGCVNFLGASSTVERSGGTSLSAPLTSGAAALVIQAYRQFHHGASPTPALIKQILISTATDLGAPAAEQGAGLLNTYKAVLLAQSIETSDGSPPPKGQSLLLSVNQLNAVAAPKTLYTWPVTVTNVGALSQSVQVSGRTLGPNESVQTGTVVLNDGSSQNFTGFDGVENNYAAFTFKAPIGADRLNASIAYPGNPSNGLNARVRLILIDPLGRFAAHSVPQGVGNFGNVDVRKPTPGTWRGVVFGYVAAMGGTNGTIQWQVSSQQFAPFASVSPSSFVLAGGQSRTILVTASTPSTPGDLAGSIVLTASGGGVDSIVGAESNSIPVTLRSLVDVAHGGNFSGVLTGGNGRSSYGQAAYYEFNVGPGNTSITANVSLTNDINDNVGAFLISPNGVALGFGQNYNSSAGMQSRSLTAYTLNPVAGTWTLVVNFAAPVVGDEISQPFSGNIVLNQVSVSASGLPNSPTTLLTAGVPVTIPVHIRNNGAASEAFFVDARLNTTVSLPLPTWPTGTNVASLPLTGYPPEWLVPTHTSSVQVAAAATLPVEFDYGPYNGDPDLFGPPTTTDNAAGSYTPSGGLVQPGIWSAVPDEIGPYAGPAPSGTATLSMTATTMPFDPNVTSTTGDLWLGYASFASFAPVVIDPGQTGTITVTIVPSGASGTIVSGYLFVDDYMNGLPPYGSIYGDELAAIPYSYRIK